MAKVTNASVSPAMAAQPASASPLEGLLAENLGAVISREPAKQAEVQGMVATLVRAALENTAVVTDEWSDTVRGLIAVIDKKLSDQINAIMHHEEFQALEASWRGLHKLVTTSELSTELKIRVLNISKDEIGKTFKRFQGAQWDQSPLFKKVYESEYGTLRGTPYGCLIGDYEFSHKPGDVAILAGMSKIAAAAHAPFIAAASPEIMNMESWQELPNPPDLKKLFEGPDYAPWRSLRESEDSRYVGLALPRMLIREPYSTDKNPVDSFAFDEDVEGADHGKFLWANAAYAMAMNVNRSFSRTGWCAQIRGVESGGIVEGLPCHTFRTDGGSLDMKCPTEVSIVQRREAELADLGFMPLLHAKNTDWAAFIGAQSLHKPPVYNKASANANAQLGARLPYIFAVSRFAHFLKKMVYEKVGTTGMEREKLQQWLTDWITDYVHGDPKNATEAQLAEKPLAEARVEVKDIDGNPGAYTAKFHLRPHFQLESVDVSLSLVSKVPSGKK